MIRICVETLLGSKHIALTGTGGMGKSTVAKAILNEGPIVTQFDARLFITYDGIASSSMTYQVFLDQIAEALQLSTSTSGGILQRLQTLKALLVIDNAETFLQACENDAALIYKLLEDIGSHSGTRMILTTRNTDTIPWNLLWHRIDVTGLDAEAAHEAFTAVYPTMPVDPRVAQILSDLEYHPLSINILANAAVMNGWDPSRLQQMWEERKTGVLDLAQSNKDRSLPATLEVSIASFTDTLFTLQILRVIAFLPQGAHRDDLSSIFSSSSDISRQVESILRSSLIYQNGDRLTMLAPIRLYISDQYNCGLPYDDPVLCQIRTHFHSRLSRKSHDFVAREYGNVDHLMHFDMKTSLYHSDVKIRLLVLKKANHFLSCTSVQQTSLWPLLVIEAQDGLHTGVDRLKLFTSACLTRICEIDYKRGRRQKALLRIDAVEMYCRKYSPICNKWWLRCLKLKGTICHNRGNLSLAAQSLQAGLVITRRSNDLFGEASLNDSIAGVLVLQGKITEAESLFISAQAYYESNNDHSHLRNLLRRRAHIAIFQGNFSDAQSFLDKAIQLDYLHSGERHRIRTLTGKASCEGWAGNISAAWNILKISTEIEVVPCMAQFHDYLDAQRGKAYYEARMGNFDDARKSIAHATELQSNSEVGGRWQSNLMSACIESLANERVRAIEILQNILNESRGDDKQWTAIYQLTLGEIMLLESRGLEAKTQFEAAKAICDATSMSPKHLFVNIYHWYALPAEYDGWGRFLDDL